MNWRRVWGVVLRHLYNFRHSWDRVTDMFYWPAMDILLWGLTSAWIVQATDAPADVVLVLLTALVYWQVVWRSQYEITVNLLEELWSENLVNLFGSPLSIYEWMTASMILGIVKMILTIIFALVLVWLLYGVSILAIGLMAVPFIVVLLASGWWIGFIIAGIIVRHGTRIQTLAWSGVYLLAPFSAIYYPVAVLPEWAQKIAAIIPMSYVFEGMRQALYQGTFNARYLAISTGLTVIYIVMAGGFFVGQFKKRQERGLASLD